ncbi:YdbL family protein [Nitrosomonas sp.]|uniref:YdbL family protein n=1 Tax=Nitrosomonas sp. TaxID=42353 RepID=UPI0025F47167|nr:YdbL family protein [Nitrosomonas sp.]
MYKQLIRCTALVLLGLFLWAGHAGAVDFEANTPAVTRLKQNMQQRHNQLAPFYDTGAVGLTHDGLIVLRDANAVPLSGRQAVNALVSAENQDRNALYREIALANNHPEWENDIRSTFAQRWIASARSGWWYQLGNGTWQKK